MFNLFKGIGFWVKTVKLEILIPSGHLAGELIFEIAQMYNYTIYSWYSCFNDGVSIISDKCSDFSETLYDVSIFKADVNFFLN